MQKYNMKARLYVVSDTKRWTNINMKKSLLNVHFKKTFESYIINPNKK